MNVLNNWFLALDANLTSSDLAYGIATCITAILMGAYLAKKQARAFSGQTQNGLPVVTCRDYGDMRFLHLGTPAVQGSMQISKPFDIHLEYQQRMMGWLLFADLDQLSHLHAMQLGLGAASLTKFCHHHLNMQSTAVELNPQVIATCRLSFQLPDDNAKLKVVLADAAQIAKDKAWHNTVDALQVDLYDQEADRPVLDSEDFYRDCRQLLTTHGCMAVNLFGKASRYDQSLKRITTVFGKDAVWEFKPTAAGNTIVLALRTARQIDHNALLAQAQTIQTRWPLPATKWLNALTPVV